MVIVIEDLSSSPDAVRFNQNAVFSLKLQSADQLQETVTVTYALPNASDVVFAENGSKTIGKLADVFSSPTLVQRSYALRGVTTGKIVSVVATIEQPGTVRKSPGLVTILA
jgi:hypothetical protein